MASLSVRSLIRMGAGGLVVVIPKAWARSYGLQPGDKVVVIANGKLVVKPLKRRKGNGQPQP